MITTADLDIYVKTAAHDYISKGISLDDSIIKIASTHALNRDQINRVVEGANTEVYVQLMNQSQDKYVNFENADSEKIASVALSTTPEVKAASTSDYITAPETISNVGSTTFNIFSSGELPTATKTAEELQGYYKLAALETQLENTLYELDVQFQQQRSNLYNMVKQAVLGGVDFGDINKAITSVYPQPVITASMEEIKEKLAMAMPLKKFASTSDAVGTVNQDNPLIKQAGSLVKIATEYVNVRAKRQETTGQLVDHIKQAGVFKTMLQHPGPSLTIGAAGVVGGVALHKHIENVKERDQNSALKSIPQNYLR